MNAPRWLSSGWIAAMLCAPLASAGGVVIVGQGGNQSYATLQAAVDAAADGDVLLVGDGSYPGFRVQDRSLSIFAAPGASVQILGPVEVVDLSAGRSVLLAGLTGVASTPPGATVPASGLWLAYNDGDVRVEGCAFQGDDADAVLWNALGGPGVSVVNSARVVLSRSTFTGGAGRMHCSMQYTCDASQGGVGLAIRNSTAAVYDCRMEGGRAGYYESCGGDGGHGAEVFNSEVWLAGTQCAGADGEWSCFGSPGPGGDGGDGLVILSGKVHALDDALSGGFQGIGNPSGQDGQPLVVSGGAWLPVAGTARRVVAERVVDDQAPASITLQGVAGDRVWLPVARAPSLRLAPFLGGWWLVPFPAKMPLAPLGTVPASGALPVALPVGRLPDGTSGAAAYGQAYVIDAQGGAWLAAPLHLLVLNHDGLPDCDANGVLDYLDAAQAPALDCNTNLVLDDCEVAGGQVPDCNANGVPDECDIGSGVSTDLNADGIPDECQPGVTLWVDASAAAGGNGTPAAPFQALGEALAAATAQTVLVLVDDGLYAGPSNRDLDFGGKQLLFKSLHGPAGCVVDLQGAGRLAVLQSGETAHSGWRGFTVRNGAGAAGGALLVDGADLQLSDCVFEGCAATGADGGGVLRLAQGRADLRDCVLRGGTATFGVGGAVSIGDGGALTASRCTLVDNSAREGGAIAMDGRSYAFLGHSRLLHNAATAGDGGAIRAHQQVWQQIGWLRVSNCLLAGNSAAGRGGALYLNGVLYGGNSSPANVWDTTFAANSAGAQGGAVYTDPYVWFRPYNSVLWGNSAPLGSQVAVTASPFANVVSLRACDLEGGLAGVHNPSGMTLGSLYSIAADPLYADPDGPDNDPTTYEDNDYSLGAGSPCTDAGEVFANNQDFLDVDGDGDLGEAPPLDLVLQPRRVDDPNVPDTGIGEPPLVDMGCYERQ